MTENKTVKNLYQIWLKENPHLFDSKIIFNRFLNSVLTFQDHYELWLKENNQDRTIWTYEKWINEYCFKNLRSDK
jgi:hypothetical protein